MPLGHATPFPAKHVFAVGARLVGDGPSSCSSQVEDPNLSTALELCLMLKRSILQHDHILFRLRPEQLHRLPATLGGAVHHRPAGHGIEAQLLRKRGRLRLLGFCTHLASVV